MAKIKASYDSEDEIPTAYADLYTEEDGRWVMTEVEDVGGALQKERSHRRKAEGRLRAFGDLDPEQVVSDLAELEELRKNKGKVPEDVAAEWAQKEQSLREQFDKTIAEKDASISKLRGGLHKSFLETKVRAALNNHEAHVDIMLPHIMERARVNELEDGSLRETIVDRDGNVQLTTGRGTGERTIDEEVARMSKDPAWAAGFKPQGLSGSGAGQPTGARATGKAKQKGPAVRVPNAKIDLEAMAAGEQIPEEWD